MKKQFLLISFILAQASFIFASYSPIFNNNIRSNYLDRYSEIAIIEMQRSSIPASITLAQGILESAWGKGDLAALSNNHFGIKCKSDWDGPTVPYKDDDYDANGNLIKSCFRAYENPYDSYRDHTNFLLNGQRYASLFDLHPMDYIGWAKGLKACGYATAPDYAERLIRIIEENQLYLYDVNYIQENQVSDQPIAEETVEAIANNTTRTQDFSDDKEEEYLETIKPSRINTMQTPQTIYTRIYTTNQTPEVMAEIEALEEEELVFDIVESEPVQTLVIAKPIIHKPIETNNHLNRLQVFSAPKFDISQFLAEQNHAQTTSSVQTSSVERERSAQHSTIPTFVPAERLMNIRQQKNHSQQSKKGVSLPNMKLR